MRTTSGVTGRCSYYFIMATFAQDGPQKCSGLPVRRYSTQDLRAEFGPSLRLWAEEKEEHVTPFGTIQKFIYCRFLMESG